MCTIDNNDNYECHCTDDTTGQTCPEPTLCDDQPCLNGGQCQLKGALFECNCEPGFHGNLCEHKSICHPDHNPCGSGVCNLSILGTYEVNNFLSLFFNLSFSALASMVQWELNADRLQNIWSIIYRLCGCFSYFSKQSLLHDYKQIYIYALSFLCTFLCVCA